MSSIRSIIASRGSPKDGTFIGQFGSPGTGEGQFNSPWGITVDSDGFVYVADHKNHRVQKLDADGNY